MLPLTVLVDAINDLNNNCRIRGEKMVMCQNKGNKVALFFYNNRFEPSAHVLFNSVWFVDNEFEYFVVMIWEKTETSFD